MRVRPTRRRWPHLLTASSATSASSKASTDDRGRVGDEHEGGSGRRRVRRATAAFAPQLSLRSPQGMAAESSSAAVILLSSSFGYSLSTTHVATGSVLGTGIGKKGAQVRWGVAGRMATAWLFTLPAAAVVGAVTCFLAHLIGGTAGVIVMFIVLLAIAAFIYLRSRRTAVHAGNVNQEWAGGVAPPRRDVAASTSA
ncbi:inorganic phosphate transporter [Pseudonocardia sp. GCM10023141]|uniref:inorganic phosphate transporter n=1 Tax=Pseudonocardia sp. GCM10023141 TaxID=3252653 RepID=UPI003622C885